jgi:hypothetical protein
MTSPTETHPLLSHVRRRLEMARRLTAGVNPAWGPTWFLIRVPCGSAPTLSERR